MITRDKKTIAGMALSASVIGGLSYLLWLFFFTGCASTSPPADHGIPNFSWVDKDWGICRGGQPTLQGWYWLSVQSAGQSPVQGSSGKINHVIKLNDLRESSDSVASLQLGMEVDYNPISTLQQLDPGDDTARDLDTQIHQTLHLMRPGTFIHCERGEDRTGAFVYAYRRNNGWSEAAARQEMLTNGFHPILLGLKRFVDNYIPAPSLPQGPGKYPKQ